MIFCAAGISGLLANPAATVLTGSETSIAERFGLASSLAKTFGIFSLPTRLIRPSADLVAGRAALTAPPIPLVGATKEATLAACGLPIANPAALVVSL